MALPQLFSSLRLDTKGHIGPLSLVLLPDQHQGPPRPGFTCHQGPTTILQKMVEKPKGWHIFETSRGEMSASYSTLGGKEYWDFACRPRIRAHCLTAGLNRLDVHLRHPRKFRVIGPCCCRIQKRELSSGCTPLWWCPPENSLGISWAQHHGRLSLASRGWQHRTEPVG